MQEIGPRFTLKLRSLKKGIPVVENVSKPPPALEFANDGDENPLETPEGETMNEQQESGAKKAKAGRAPSTNDDFEWAWKVGLHPFKHQPNLIRLSYSLSWKQQGERSFYRNHLYLLLSISCYMQALICILFSYP